tara:strand:+ start:325 stop:465 length:141 start_codon:yes stop_codon:yes gene_type:complete
MLRQSAAQEACILPSKGNLARHALAALSIGLAFVDVLFWFGLTGAS